MNQRNRKVTTREEKAQRLRVLEVLTRAEVRGLSWEAIGQRLGLTGGSAACWLFKKYPALLAMRGRQARGPKHKNPAVLGKQIVERFLAVFTPEDLRVMEPRELAAGLGLTERWVRTLIAKVPELSALTGPRTRKKDWYQIFTSQFTHEEIRTLSLAYLGKRLGFTHQRVSAIFAQTPELQAIRQNCQAMAPKRIKREGEIRLLS